MPTAGEGCSQLLYVLLQEYKEFSSFTSERAKQLRTSKLNGELNNNSSCVSVLPMELTVDDSIYQNN